jgi:hypothetical protein
MFNLVSAHIIHLILENNFYLYSHKWLYIAGFQTSCKCFHRRCKACYKPRLKDIPWVITKGLHSLLRWVVLVRWQGSYVRCQRMWVRVPAQHTPIFLVKNRVREPPWNLQIFLTWNRLKPPFSFQRSVMVVFWVYFFLTNQDRSSVFYGWGINLLTRPKVQFSTGEGSIEHVLA